LNVNAKQLRDIKGRSKSKVKESIKKGSSNTKSCSNINYFTTRTSCDGNKETEIDSHTQMTDLKKTYEDCLNELSSRVLSRFMQRKASTLYPGEYEIGVVFSLIVALVDD
jgi:hypothetical protein